MALLLLKRSVRIRPAPGGATYNVTSWVHNTDTFADQVLTTTEAENPGALSLDPTVLAGWYCRFTTRVNVYHKAAQDGTSRLEELPNSTSCPAIPPPPPPPGSGGGAATGLDNDPQAPPGARLLKRQCKPQPGGVFSYTDKYYDPATRTIVSLNSAVGAYAATCTVYTLPVGEVFDRWCLEKGVAPFTERQVSWDGLNDLVFADVDNVTACQLPACTLTLSATVTPAGATGRGAVTLVPAGAVGPLVYRRVGSTEAAQSSPDFLNLPTGRYVFEARETRTGGCVATVAVRLTATYGLRYLLPYQDADSRCCALRYYERGYTGEVEKLKGKPDAVEIDWPGSALDHVYTTRLRGSECAMRLLLTYAGQMLDTFSGDERLFRVENHIESTLFWRGYLLQEQYSVPFLPGKREFSLQATDGLGTLDGLPFTGPLGEALTGEWSALQIIDYCLSRLDLELPLRTRCLVFPRGASVQQNALAQVRFDVSQYSDEKGKAWSCGKVLSAWLDVLQARVMQQDGALWLERLADLTTGELTYYAYDVAGQPAPAVTRTLLRTRSTPDEGTLYWLNAEQLQGLRGAVRAVTVEAQPGELVDLLHPAAFLDATRVDAAGRPLGWSGGAPASVLPATKRSGAGTLLLPGAAPGATPQATDFLQTPASLAVPTSGNVEALPLQVRFTVTVRSTETMPADDALKPRLYVGVRHGQQWLGMADTPGEGPQRLVGATLYGLDSTQQIELGGYGRIGDDTRAEVVLRFLQVAAPAGHAPYDVEISDLTLTWGVLGFVDTYADFTTQESELLVTRLDEGQTLFHTDTPQVRLQGTLLDASGHPTETWFEPSLPAQLVPLHAYLVNDRFRWQQRPAQTLSGTLRGALGPGALLTDPFEQRPGVYLLPSARYHGPLARWTISAVQVLPLAAPPRTPYPEGAIYYENATPWLSETGAILLYEDA